MKQQRINSDAYSVKKKEEKRRVGYSLRIAAAVPRYNDDDDISLPCTKSSFYSSSSSRISSFLHHCQFFARMDVVGEVATKIRT